MPYIYGEHWTEEQLRDFAKQMNEPVPKITIKELDELISFANPYWKVLSKSNHSPLIPEN